MRKITFFLVFALIGMSLCSCQKAVFDDEEEGLGDGVKLQFHITQFEQVPFDVADATRGTDIRKICPHLNFAVYQSGERVKQINQTSSEGNFGSFNLSLKPGQYQLVVLAHSSEENPTMTDPCKVAFTNKGKVTDTFGYGDTITVTNDSAYHIKLKRLVAMVRLQTTDTVTREAKLVRFYYTGGSSTLDAMKSVGCVNSKQVADNKGLNLQVTTHDSKNNVLVQENISNVPIQRNMITLYKGRLFNRNADSKGDFNVDLNSDDEWTTDEHPF